MNTTQKAITLLLRSAVTGESLPLPQGFEIRDAIPLIRRHHMVTLAYEGALHCGLSPQDPVMLQLFQGYCKSLAISERQLAALARIYAAFDENQIDYMPLKGCNMKALYPKPELRMMGDADILIRLEQYGQITPLLEALGFTPRCESDHELPWTCSSLYLELHKRLIPSYNKDFHAYFGDGWQLARNKEGTRWSMTPEDELIYLFTHFAKHFRDGGVGCRHVVDLWVWLRAHPELDRGYVDQALNRLQLLEFYRNMCRLMAVWFEDAPSDDKLDYISEVIFASGSWGQMESLVLSRAVRDSRHSLLGFNGKLLYAWQTLFPGVDMLREKYTILKKAPWMLPAVWLVRPFYKVLFERKTLKRHEQGLNALSEENLQTRRQLLSYVGLDYHF